MNDIEQLDYNLALLPDMCYHKNTIQANGPSGVPPVIGLKKGEKGYWPVYTDVSAEDLNKERGVTEAQASAMLNGSVFGFHTRSADPGDPVNQPKKE